MFVGLGGFVTNLYARTNRLLLGFKLFASLVFMPNFQNWIEITHRRAEIRKVGLYDGVGVAWDLHSFFLLRPG